MVKPTRQLKDPRSCLIRIGGLFLWGEYCARERPHLTGCIFRLINARKHK